VKVCSYCGRESEDAAMCCPECGGTLPDGCPNQDKGIKDRVRLSDCAASLLRAKGRPASFRVLSSLDARSVAGKCLLIVAALGAGTAGVAGWPFVIGLCAGSVAFEVATLKFFKRWWPWAQQWLDWTKLEDLNSARKHSSSLASDGLSATNTSQNAAKITWV